MTAWTYMLADLRSNAITAELPLSDVTFGKRLGDAGAFNATWTLSSKWQGGDPYTLTRPARTAIYALYGGRPWWGGVLWTSNYDSSTGKVTLGAADWWSYFDHRKVLPVLGSPLSTTAIAQLTTTYSGVEQNGIAASLVALAQSHTGGNIGVVVDQTVSGILRDRTYPGYTLTDVGQALRQLSQVIDGPDLMFDVGADLDVNGRPVRLLRVGSPLLAQTGDPWTFELGGTLLTYQWPSDGTRMRTRSYAVGPGTETSELVAVAEDVNRYNDGWPLLETDTSYPTVQEADTLQGHADADQLAGRLPAALPRLVVRGDGRDAAGRILGPSVAEISPGDYAHVAIKDQFFRRGISSVMRLVAIDVTPGGEGPTTATLTTSPTLDDLA